jgi:hypothetical protein
VASHADRIPIGTPPDKIQALLRDRQPDSSIDVQGLAAELDRLKAKKKELETPRMVYGGTFREPETTFVLRRGDPEQRLDEIEPAVPAFFNVTSDATGLAEQERRLALARWIASPDNPLAARVMVNRIWMYHFGRGLVATPSDWDSMVLARRIRSCSTGWPASSFVAAGRSSICIV